MLIIVSITTFCDGDGDGLGIFRLVFIFLLFMSIYNLKLMMKKMCSFFMTWPIIIYASLKQVGDPIRDPDIKDVTKKNIFDKLLFSDKLKKKVELET